MTKPKYTHFQCRTCRRVFTNVDEDGNHLDELHYVSQDEAVALILAGRVQPLCVSCSRYCPGMEPPERPPHEDTRLGGVRST